MDRSTACTVLGVTPDALGPLSHNYRTRRAEIEERLAAAPTDSLREKLRRNLAELEEAYAVLSAPTESAAPPDGLSVTQVADLPDASPFYTGESAPTAAAPGARVGLSAGQILCERYEIRELIGAGGMGAVYAAFDRNRDKEIAIKVLLPSLTKDARARERFLNEARLSSELSHPGIVNVFDVQNDGALYFLTMEKLEGHDLRRKLNLMKERGQPFSVEESTRIGTALCDALTYAHDQGAVHRDVKPENVFLCDDGSVKLMDFGIARLMRTSQMTMTGTSMGTAYYMAPEQLDAAKEVDGRADQYAVGAVLYEMLTGKPPSGRFKSADEVNPSVPAGLSAAVDRALSGDLEDRFSDLAQLGTQLTYAGDRRAKKAKTRSSNKRSASRSPQRTTTESPRRLGRPAIIVTALVVLAGTAVTYPRWSGPLHTAIKNATRDSAAQAKAEEARDDALAARQALAALRPKLPKPIDPGDATDADNAFARGERDYDAHEDSAAEASYREAMLAYQSLTDGLHSKLGEETNVAKGRFNKAYDDWRAGREALHRELSDLERTIERAEDELRDDRARNRAHTEQKLDADRAKLRHLTRYVAIAQSHLFSDAIDLGATDAKSRASAAERERPQDALPIYADEAARLNRALDRTAELRAAVTAELAADDAKLAYDTTFDQSELEHRSLTARGAIADHANAATSMSRGEFQQSQQLNDNARAAFARATSELPAFVAARSEGESMAVAYHSTLAASKLGAEPTGAKAVHELTEAARTAYTAGEFSAAAQRFRQIAPQWRSLRQLVDSTASARSHASSNTRKLEQVVQEAAASQTPPAAAAAFDLLDSARASVQAGNFEKATGQFTDAATSLQGLTTTIRNALATRQPAESTRNAYIQDLQTAELSEPMPSAKAGETSLAAGNSALSAYDFPNATTAYRDAESRFNAARQEVVAALWDRVLDHEGANRPREALATAERLLVVAPDHAQARTARQRLRRHFPLTLDFGGATATFIYVDAPKLAPNGFDMGSPATEEYRNDNETQHRVNLTRGYWLQTTEVTQAQWRAVMGNNPSRFKGDQRPVEGVSWDDCQTFITKLNALLADEGIVCRLPTEAEWEFACRAGTTTPFSFGATISTRQANYDGNHTYGSGRNGEYRETTTNVASFPENPWGFYDMHGNVWEWCQDWYDEYSGDATDPTGPRNGSHRVLRGGSWDDYPRRLRSANRIRISPAYRISYYGFRLALGS